MIPSFLRFAFHDCVDGCDGCMNPEQVSKKSNSKQALYNLHQINLARAQMSHATISDGFFKDGVSNGLDTERYVGLMSRTYRRFRRDISRADFQALAAIVAVEMAVEENNAFCAEDTRVRERGTVATVLFWTLQVMLRPIIIVVGEAARWVLYRNLSINEVF